MAEHSRPPRRSLDQISTHWTKVNDPASFFTRYSAAVIAYLEALLKNHADAQDVLSEILEHVVRHGFEQVTPERGRFRDYLKITVRNRALTWLRRKRPATVDAVQLQETIGDDRDADEAFLHAVRRCHLDKAWRSLERYQHRNPGNLGYTVLKLTVDHPNEDSTALAARVREKTGESFAAAAFRQQLSRARRRFADRAGE
jgi:RNA polymerase sigma factor (sigma-70 family)